MPRFTQKQWELFSQEAGDVWRHARELLRCQAPVISVNSRDADLLDEMTEILKRLAMEFIGDADMRAQLLRELNI